MEELKIRAYGMELKVSGEQETIKGASKDFYEFLGVRASEEMKRRAAFAEKLRVALEEGKATETADNRKAGSCIFRSAKGIPASWEEIAKEIKEGVEYEVGDKVDCELKSGEKVTFVITDVTDEYVRFESVDCIGDKEVYWSKEGNTKCGLAISDVMNYLNDEIWNQLPDDLQRVIDPVTRKHKDSDGNVKEYRFALFLPAASEVFDEDECYGDQGVYEQLEYYKDRRNRMRGAKKGEDTEPYWLASVRSGSSAHACSVNGSGGANAWGASYAYRVPVCFCIKKS